MFTGIIECIGIINECKTEGSNKVFLIQSSITQELRIDQSISHDGICLTVEKIEGTKYQVTAIKETIEKSNISNWQVGQKINLERSVKLGDRLDGHLVQGHVDCTAICKKIEEQGGSWLFDFSLQGSNGLVVNKGSITINGISLTTVNPSNEYFSVAIIPYTYNNTNFQSIQVGDIVNIEFDIIGKYVAQLLEERS